MTDRDDIDMRAWASRAFENEPAAGSVGDTIGGDLTRAHTGLTRRRRWTAGASGVAIAATIGALVATANAWQSPSGGSPEVAGQLSLEGLRGDRVPLDLEQLSPAQADEVLEKCVHGGDSSGMRVAYAWKIDVPDWKDWYWGDWYLPYDAALVAVNEAEQRAWVCTGAGDNLDDLSGRWTPPVTLMSGWEGSSCPSPRYQVDQQQFVRVSDEVDRVEIRFGPADDPGPWWVSRAHEGYVFVAWWLNLPRDTDETYRVEAQAYDVDGNPIESDVLTERVNEVFTPRMINSCQWPS